MKNIILILFVILLSQCRIVKDSFQIMPYRIEVENVVKKKNSVFVKPKIQRLNKPKNKYWYKYNDTSVKIGDTITIYLKYDKKYPIK